MYSVSHFHFCILHENFSILPPMKRMCVPFTGRNTVSALRHTSALTYRDAHIYSTWMIRKIIGSHRYKETNFTCHHTEGEEAAEMERLKKERDFPIP